MTAVDTPEIEPTDTELAAEDASVDGGRPRRVPFWRRPRRLRRQIAGTLVVTSLVAVALFGALNYYAADQLLRNGAQDQLESVADARARSIELGTDRLLGAVSTAGVDRGVAVALEEFTAAFVALGEAELTPDQDEALDAFYQTNVITPIDEAGIVDVDTADVVPTDPATRYLQYHYTVDDGSGDDTAYRGAIIESDEYLRGMAAAIGRGDLLLIDSDGNIVYSADKRIDLGTNIDEGVHQTGVLADLVNDGLERIRTGESTLSNFTIYVPGGAKPQLFAATAVRSGSEIIGALVVEVPADALARITTAGGNWTDVGLLDGESYVVSSDLLLQSASRPWIEDQEAYLDEIGDDELRRELEVLGSPVGVQPVDTEPVRAAFDGESFSGSTTNYLGSRTYSSSTSIDIPGVEWVVVTDIPLSSARKPLNRYLWRMVLVALVVLPIAGLIGVWMARRLTRPIQPAVNAARAVAEGERELDLPTLGNDEFGDLARRLDRMAKALGAQEHALSDEYDRRRDLLLAVLPPHLVEGDDAVTDQGDQADIASVIAVAVGVDRDEVDLDDDLADTLASITSIGERLAEERHVDRIRVAADRSLFLAGVGNDDPGAEDALSFAAALSAQLAVYASDAGLALDVHIGVSTGPVGTGVLEQGSLTFGAWGEPVRRALAISALSKSNEVLIDESTADAAADAWTTSAVEGIVDLDDEQMTLFTLATSPTAPTPAATIAVDPS